MRFWTNGGEVMTGVRCGVELGSCWFGMNVSEVRQWACVFSAGRLEIIVRF